MLFSIVFCFTGCDEYTAPVNGTAQDTQNTKAAANTLQANQATPTDIQYSLERYNLIRRAYWVSGDYLYSDIPFEVDKPVLTITEGE